MAKRIISLFFMLLLFFALVGCSGVDRHLEIENRLGYSRVKIDAAFNWDEKTDAERLELAAFAVQKCLNETEYPDDLSFIWGTYEGRKVFVYDKDTHPDVTVDETLIAEEDAAAAREVRLIDTSVGQGDALGKIFYSVEVSASWFQLSSSDRDGVARKTIAEYDAIGLAAGYNEERSIVTGYLGNYFAFGEEDLDDGRQITIFDSETDTRRITK